MKKNTFIITVSFIAILVIGLAGVYYFVFMDVVNKNIHTSDLQNTIASENEKNQYIQSIDQTLKTTDSDIQSLHAAIVSTDGSVDFIEKLENTAKALGLDITIDSITLVDTPDLANTNMVTLDVKAKTSGTWSATSTFLEELESFPFVLHTENLDLEETTDVSSPQKVQVWQSSFELHVLKHK